MKLHPAMWVALLVPPAMAIAQQPAVIGAISGATPIEIDGVMTAPSAAPSWPVTERDRVNSTAEAARFTTNDGNLVVLDPATKTRVRTIYSDRRPYIYVLQGGVHFATRDANLYICIAGRLYRPKTESRGSLRLDKSGKAVQSLDRGGFLEQGGRACDEDAAAVLLSDASLAGTAAGAAAVATGTAVAGGTAVAAGSTVAAGTAIAAAGAIAAGAGVAAASSSSTAATSACDAANGCNFNPASSSPSSPIVITPTGVPGAPGR